MTRIVMWVASTATIVTLLFGYRTSTMGALDLTTADGGQSPVISSDSTGSGSTGSGSTGSGSGSSGSSGSDSSGSGSSGSTKSRVLTGDSIFTRYGAVQVELTVKGSAIT